MTRKNRTDPVAWSGFFEEYVKNVCVKWSDEDQGNGPTGEAIRTGTTVLI